MSLPRWLAGASASPTPFYAFDRRTLTAISRRWEKAAETHGARLFYPYKCNRLPIVLDHLARKGFGAEINVSCDLSLALKRGIVGPRLLLQGPAKTPEMIDKGLIAEGAFVIDSKEDLAAVLGRARALQRQPRYLLRLRVAEARRSQQSFGMSSQQVLEAARTLVARRDALPLGLAFHLGTGILSAAPYTGAIRRAASLARVLEFHGIPVRVVDVGGGFSVAGETRHTDTDNPRPQRSRFTSPERIIATMAAETRRLFRSVDVWLEPGRALVSEAFHLVARVIRVCSGGQVFLDASRVSHGFFVSRGTHRVVMYPRRRGRPSRLLLAGPLGTELDTFTRVRLVRPREGDMVVIASVGAYNLIAANEWAGPVHIQNLSG